MFVLITAVLVFVLILLFMLIAIYNALIALNKNIDLAWSNIDIILKQRFDEIPQLIEVIEQYVIYEKNMIQKVIDARAMYIASKDNESKIEASNSLSQILRGFSVVVESNPQLKANDSFLQLQKRISDLESALSDRREFYNEAVTIYNIRIAQYPDIFFAKLLKYKEKALFKPAEQELVRPNLIITTIKE